MKVDDDDDDRSAYLHPRIPAIQVPCPCASLSARTASVLSTGGLSIVYLSWSIASWYSFRRVDELKSFVSRDGGGEFDELRQIATFALVSAWYFTTVAVVSSASFVVSSVWPHREVAKHLSRVVWLFGWVGTWVVGVVGVAAYLSRDAWLVAGCDRDGACERFRQKLQISIVVALVVTLALVFWFAVVLSAFVHTLHPDVFHLGEVDSELDEYDHACLLEDELIPSEHPLAASALRHVRAEREALYLARLEREQQEQQHVRRRKGYRQGREDSSSGLEEDASDLDEGGERGGGGRELLLSGKKGSSAELRRAVAGDGTTASDDSSVTSSSSFDARRERRSNVAGSTSRL
ncbi:hypothetical protein JCM3766R1_001548 [Sporobolomyces carnicolor]